MQRGKTLANPKTPNVFAEVQKAKHLLMIPSLRFMFNLLSPVEKEETFLEHHESASRNNFA